MNVLYNKLEFDKIIKQVATFSLSTGGENVLLNSEHSADVEYVKTNLAMLAELTDIYSSPTSTMSVSRFYDISDFVNRTIKHDVLSATELYEVGVTINQYFVINDYITAQNVADQNKCRLLNEILSVTKLAKPFYTQVINYIDSDGNISSKASPELARIRKELGSVDARITATANDVLERYRVKNALMSENVAIHDGLPCIGVKPAFKYAMSGMIVDSSATGQTIFIVPSEVLQIYNEAKLLRDQELAEINKILKKYCLDIADQSDVLLQINRELINFDVINAKARYTIANEYNIPKISDNGYIELINAKNPFLAGKVVPLNIHIGDEYKTLIITGPNTGGKTVALKTTGLCVLMAGWGLGIPADDNSTVGVFENVFADIGDDQSIASSLSTFSSHITNINNIINIIDNNYRPNQDKKSAKNLVLIDELGTGTDPSEGEALAISIIKYLTSRNVISIVTSHFNGLKYFATQEPEISNAAMDFDVNKGVPTFQLKIGIPGSSKAIEISEKLGIPNSIISDARNIISCGCFDIDKIIENLNIQRKKLDEAVEENARLKNEMENKIAESVHRIDVAKQKNRQLTELINNQKKDFLRHARKEFEHIIQNIKDNNADKQSIKTGLSFFEKVNNQIEQSDKFIDKKHSDEQQLSNCIGVELNVGDNVLIISKNIKATVLSKANTKKNIAFYTVQAGIIKMNVGSDDLHKLDTKKSKPNSVKKVSFVPSTITMSLDIRGLRCDEAERKLDDFIDSSMLNNYGEVRIIHGMGTGALREFVVNYLKYNSLVVDYGYEKDAGGGLNYGVTEVKLR